MKKLKPDYKSSFLRHFKEGEVFVENQGKVTEGDLIVCKLLEFTKLETPEGQVIWGFPDSLLLTVYANRFSTRFRVGIAPDIELPIDEPLDVLSVSGAIGKCISYSRTWAAKPTKVELIGRVVDENGEQINMRDLRVVEPATNINCEVPLIVVGATSAEAGKTTIVTSLVNYFKRKGITSACVKICGTGSRREKLKYEVAGAIAAYDAVDAGFATTYTEKSDDVVHALKGLMNRACEHNPDVLFVELGGDVIGANSQAVLSDDEFRNKISVFILASNDSFASFGCCRYLDEMYGLKPLFISGRVSENSVGCERSKKLTGIETLDITEEVEKAGDLVWNHIRSVITTRKK